MAVKTKKKCANLRPIPKEMLISLRKRLPWGGIQRIADDSGTDRDHVRRVLERGVFDRNVLLSTMKVIKQYEQDQIEVRKAMESM